VTVSKSTGHFFTPHGVKVELTDLPGCHSLVYAQHGREPKGVQVPCILK
jgi:Fe2+ transport system protein B